MTIPRLSMTYMIHKVEPMSGLGAQHQRKDSYTIYPHSIDNVWRETTHTLKLSLGCVNGLIMFSAETHISFCAFTPFLMLTNRRGERCERYAEQMGHTSGNHCKHTLHLSYSLNKKNLKLAPTSEHLFTSSRGQPPQSHANICYSSGTDDVISSVYPSRDTWETLAPRLQNKTQAERLCRDSFFINLCW